MATIKPFRGIRPVSNLVRRIVSPPYDVLNPEEARALANEDPLTFVRVIRPEVDFPAHIDPHSPEVYDRGASNLRELIESGNLIMDETPRFYIYELARDRHFQRGLMCGLSLDEYDRGLIRRHELTISEKELDRARHMQALEANTGLVLATYRAMGAIDRLVDGICDASSPVSEVISPDGVSHRLWAVDGRHNIRRLEGFFAEAEALYIADGHHRAAAAARYRGIKREHDSGSGREGPWDYFLGVLFPHDQLRIFGYNRLIRDLGGLDRQTLLDRIGESFIISKAGHILPDRPKLFGMYLEGEWYRLEALEGTYPKDDPVLSLDVSILQKNLLAPVLGIGDPREDRRVDFLSGRNAVAEMETRCGRDMKLAFTLFPLKIEQVMLIADRGVIMPPKSTWFEPKLLSGLVVRSLKGPIS
ncbi:MAG TPA: DUF1015 family protein [Spirochaetia bacterium]|nr:DUF1015 family protein [Spirochaetia bacterium]